MASRVGSLLLWIWLTQRTALCLPESVQNFTSTVTNGDLVTEESEKSVSVVLKKCCQTFVEDDYSSGANANENCGDTEDIILNWNSLKQYHIPRDGKTRNLSVSTIGSEGLENQLDCENIIQYSVPKQNESSTLVKKLSAFFADDGHFQYKEHIYSPQEYCIERVTPGEIRVLACNKTSYCSQYYNSSDTHHNTRPCIFRCCNYGEVWNVNGSVLQCSNSGEKKWRPNIYSHVNSDNPLTQMQQPVSIVATHPRNIRTNCFSQHTFQSSHAQLKQDIRFGKKPFKVLQDGSLMMKLRKLNWIRLEPGKYCVDGFQNGTGTFSGNNEDAVLFECDIYETQEDLEGKVRQRKYSMSVGIILIICLFFLLLTTIVYILLWSKHNIHGWTVFCYILALLALYIMLGASHFSTITMARVQEVENKKAITTVCGVIGILTHFAFLSAFSWSTTLNYDLWTTFRNLRPTTRKSSGLKKFLCYCLFAVAVPTSIVATGIVLDVKYDVNEDIITPGYGMAVCYVEPRLARFYFVIVPIASLLGINFLFFCNTAYSVYKVKKSTQFASSSSTKTESGDQTLRLILKLLLINGSIWTVEIISWYIQSAYDEVGPVSLALDVLNVLQAVAIFFLFVFKNDILDALKKTYPRLEGPVNAAFKLKRLGRRSTTTLEGRTSATAVSYTSRTNDNNTPATKL